MDKIRSTVVSNIKSLEDKNDQNEPNISDFNNFRFHDNIGLFESQRRYTYTAPELTMAQRKMDTALRLSALEHIVFRMSNDPATLEEKLLYQHLGGVDISSVAITPDLYPRILKRILIISAHCQHICTSSKRWISKSIKLAMRSWEIQVSHMRSSIKYETGCSSITDTSNLDQFLSKSVLLRNISNVIYIFENIINKMTIIESYNKSDKTTDECISELNNHTLYDIPDLNLEFKWTWRYSYVNFDGNLYIIHKPYITMIHNKLCSLLSILLYCKLSEGPCHLLWKHVI